MALPLLSTPEYDIEVPSTKETITIRPFLVKEEKILLTALEGGDEKEIVKSIKQVMKNCILSDVEIDNLSFFDFEYIFLMMRSKSVGDVIELNLEHHCGQMNKVSIDINSIQVQFSEDHSDTIKLNDDISIKMKYPTISNTDMFTDTNDVNKVFEIMETSIDYVYDSETVYDEFTKEELKSFLESMDKDQLEKIMNFFNTMPRLEHEIEYTCTNCGEVQKYILRGISDFFM